MFGVLKHVETCFIQKLIFQDFFRKYFFESIEKRLFLGEKFDFWQNFYVAPVIKLNFPEKPLTEISIFSPFFRYNIVIFHPFSGLNIYITHKTFCNCLAYNSQEK